MSVPVSHLADHHRSSDTGSRKDITAIEQKIVTAVEDSVHTASCSGTIAADVRV
jgi:hypothetical protein